MKLRAKILSVVIPLTVLPLLLLGGTAYERLKKEAEHRTFRQMETLLDQSALHIQSRIRTAIANIRLFSESELLHQYLLTDQADRYELWQPPLLKLFSGYAQAYPEYYEIRVLRPDGYEDTRFSSETVPNAREKEEDWWFQEMIQSQDSVYATFFQNPDNQETAFLIARKLYLRDSTVADISAEPALRGWLLITVRPAYIRQLVNTAGIGRNGWIFFTDARGRILFYPENRAPVPVLSPELKGLLKEQAVNKNPIKARLSGESVFFRSVPLDAGLFMIGVLPEQELLAGGRKLGKILGGIVAGSIFLATVLVFFLLNAVLVRPIRNLSRAAREIGRGNLDIRIAGNTDDEIGTLGAEFERMAAELKHVKSHLEETVASRTSELAAANAELKKTVAELKKAKEVAETASRVKTEFLANMSHEIRTPLNAVIGFISLTLENPELKPDQRRHLETALRSAQVLLGLIKDILDVSKLENGSLKLKNVPFRLHSLIQEIFGSIAREAEKKGLSAELRMDPGLPDNCIGDPFRIKQILLNLLKNAVKFTEKGSVGLHVYPGDSPKILHFAIQDTGIGIPEDRLDSIFELFSQGDSSASRRFGGTGLGTSISGKLARLMGGEIRVRSQEGKGSTFCVTLALDEAGAEAEIPEPEEGTADSTLTGGKSSNFSIAADEADARKNFSANAADRNRDCNPVPPPEYNAADLSVLRELLGKMLVSFEECNPVSADPCIEKLETLLSSRQIHSIKQHLENFDFDKAAEETLNLANRLGIACSMAEDEII
ncbi:MAG: ATP-binding protein [Desulfobacterales bacterium]